MSTPVQIDFDSEIYVELLESSRNPDAKNVTAAKCSFTKDGTDLPTEPIAGLTEYLLKNGHWSTFEQDLWTFKVTVPIFISRQLVRHRSLHFNEQSGRYTQFQPHVYMPPEGRDNAQTGKQGHYQFSYNPDLYTLTRRSVINASQTALNAYFGMVEAGVAKEVARSVLPLNMYTTIVFSGNTRDILMMMKARLHPHAQYEIRVMASKMQDLMRLKAPVIFAACDKTDFFNQNQPE